MKDKFIGVSIVGVSIDRYKENKRLAEIRRGKLAYTEKLGWVDFGHAQPSGCIKLLESIDNSTPMENNPEYVRITYGQTQKMKGIGSGVERSFIIPKSLSDEEKKVVAWSIFVHVSILFEMHQKWSEKISGSSFAGGDLNGNMLSFYRALFGYSEEEIKAMVGTKSPSFSEHIFKVNGIEKQYTFHKNITGLPYLEEIKIGEVYNGRVLIIEEKKSPTIEIVNKGIIYKNFNKKI